MKVALAVHGFPPELVGGTELAVQELARGLARRGHRVLVIAGSLQWEDGFRVTRGEDTDPGSGAAIEVARIHRDDAYFDHWHKSASPRVARAFRELLREWQPEVVHVHHWLRLTRDLVACAAREGVPALVTLHDLWTTCPIAFRVRTGTHEACEAPEAADPCLACAGAHPPHTPWIDAFEGRRLLGERGVEIGRELDLARAVLAPSSAHAKAVERFLGREEGSLGARAIAPGRDLPFEPKPRAAHEGPLRVVSWGHQSALKGTDLIVDALRALPDPGAVELTLIGAPVDAAFAADLEQRCEGLDVRRLGPFERHEVLAEQTADADLMVSGSRGHESWGLVVDEALALGLPCLLPARGAFVERVEGGAWGEGYASGDVDALARALAALANDRERVARMARAAAETPRRGSDDLLDDMEPLYAEVIERGGPEPPADAWWEERMRGDFEAAWGAELAKRSAEELGFGAAP